MTTTCAPHRLAGDLSLVTPQSATEIVRSAYAAFAAGDVPAVLELMAEDIVWYTSGRSPISGDYTGHDQVAGFLRALGERSNGTFSVEVHDVRRSGADTVAALVTLTAARNGAHLAVEAVQMWRLANGAVTSFWDYVGDEQAHDEFWA